MSAARGIGVKRALLPASASGIILFFVFPNMLGLELWPLAFVALVPFLMALHEAKKFSDLVKLSAAAGVPAFGLTYLWLTHTFTTYAGMGWGVSIAVLVLMVLVLSGFFLLFTCLRRQLVDRLRLPALFAAPIAWVAVEYLRALFPFGGFPWALLAYSQHAFLPFIQAADIFGPWGVSFMIVLVNAGITEALLARRERKPLRAAAVPLAVAALVPVLAVIYGLIRMGQVDRVMSGQPAHKVAVVQANIDQGMKWDADEFWWTMNEHMRITRELLPQKPELVIWPEGSVTVSAFNEHWARRSEIIDFLADIDAHFLFGSISGEDCGGGRCYFNSAYLLSPRCQKMLGRYDKIHLVPFGEYVPLKKLFFFADNIARGNTGSITPGNEIRVMRMPGLVFGCPICYEVIFPDQVRRFRRAGANFMTTITNDAWFGKTGAPFQHHAAVVFRAIENRVYFARAANTGVSSIVDPAGRVLCSTRIYQQAGFIGEVRPSPITTVYTRLGDWFAWLCLVLVLGAAAVGFRAFWAAPA